MSRKNDIDTKKNIRYRVYMKEIKEDIYNLLKRIQLEQETETNIFFIFHAIKIIKSKETNSIAILDASKSTYIEITNKFILYLLREHIVYTIKKTRQKENFKEGGVY